ncbi:hypothetical protein ABEY63_25645 [Priestia aryabhattai]|uniref:hypothetical protein n=1 Tax=Priestia aryabhattai TaxID=412384 RepID=UPI003D2CDB72
METKVYMVPKYGQGFAELTLLTREEAHRILDTFSTRDIVEMAYDHYNYQAVHGVSYLALDEGELVAVSKKDEVPQVNVYVELFRCHMLDEPLDSPYHFYEVFEHNYENELFTKLTEEEKEAFNESDWEEKLEVYQKHFPHAEAKERDNALSHLEDTYYPPDAHQRIDEFYDNLERFQ